MRELIKSLFELRGEMTARNKIILGAAGIALWLITWELASRSGWFPPQATPSPLDVLATIPNMHFENALVRNVWYTLVMNVYGMMIAAAISLPLGLLSGLLPAFRGLSAPFYVGLRFIPLPVIILPFMFMFGIGYTMKLWFLIAALSVYLIPTVIQRVDEVRQVHVNTVRTLGGSSWDVVRYVYLKEVPAKFWGDLCILTAISWTYISFVELINKGEGGIGALLYTAQRQSNVAMLYALVLIIILVAIMQTFAMVQLGKILFPYRDASKKLGG